MFFFFVVTNTQLNIPDIDIVSTVIVIVIVIVISEESYIRFAHSHLFKLLTPYGRVHLLLFFLLSLYTPFGR